MEIEIPWPTRTRYQESGALNRLRGRTRVGDPKGDHQLDGSAVWDGHVAVPDGQKVKARVGFSPTSSFPTRDLFPQSSFSSSVSYSPESSRVRVLVGI